MFAWMPCLPRLATLVQKSSRRRFGSISVNATSPIYASTVMKTLNGRSR